MYRVQGTKYNASTGYKVQCQYRIQSTGYIVQEAEYRVQSTRYTDYKVQSTGYWVGYRAQSAEYRVVWVQLSTIEYNCIEPRAYIQLNPIISHTSKEFIISYSLLSDNGMLTILIKYLYIWLYDYDYMELFRTVPAYLSQFIHFRKYWDLRKIV